MAGAWAASRRRSTALLAATVSTALVAMLLAACSSGGSGGGADGATTAPAAPATVAAPTPTAASGPDYAQLDRLWVDLWSTVTASDPGAAAAAAAKVDGFVTADQLAQLQQLKQQAYPGRAPAGDIVHNPVRTATGTGAATVSDCLLLPGSRLVAGGLAFTGDATFTAGRWTLGALRPTGGGLSQSACVPRAANDALLAAYRNWFAQATALGRNPDPASPLVGQLIAAGSYQQRYTAFLADLKATGEYAVLMSPGAPIQPEVYAWSGTGASVHDCRDADPAFGRFTAAGRQLTAPEKPGTLTGYEVDFVNEGGTWKVTDFRDGHNAPCVKAPSSRGLTVVG